MKIKEIIFFVLSLYSIIGLGIIFMGFGTWTDNDILFRIFRYSFITLIITVFYGFIALEE
jgi:hypothetical protein